MSHESKIRIVDSVFFCVLEFRIYNYICWWLVIILFHRCRTYCNLGSLNLESFVCFKLHVQYINNFVFFSQCIAVVPSQSLLEYKTTNLEYRMVYFAPPIIVKQGKQTSKSHYIRILRRIHALLCESLNGNFHKNY